MELKPIRGDLLIAHRADVRQFDAVNPASEALRIARIYGPFVAIGTSHMFDENRPPARISAISDRDDSYANVQHLIRNSYDKPDRVRDIDTSSRRTVLAVRSLPYEHVSGKQSSSEHYSAETAFDEVMKIVADYVETTGCALTSPTSNISGDTYMYTAVAEFP